MSSNLLELVMIVKNSGEILRKCLKKNKRYIDYWTIVDTGSTDNTPQIIEEELKDIPGKLHFSEFTNFSESRNKAFDLASNTCKYMIVLDDSYEIGEGDKLREYLLNAKADVIYLKIGYMKFNFLKDLYYSNRITKTTSKIRYMYRVHEGLFIPKKKKLEFMDEKNFYIIDHTITEHEYRTVSRYKRDVEWLLLDKEQYPKDPRPTYYLCRTLFNQAKYDESKIYLKELLVMTNMKEYTFYANYMLILLEYKDTSNKAIYQKKLLNLQKLHTDRGEPSYKLAVSFYEENNLDKLEKIMNNLIQFPIPQIGLTSLEYEIYQYNIPYLYIEVKMKLGKIDEAVSVLKDLLEKNPNDQKLLNIKYSICDNLNISSKKLAPKTLVIHTGTMLFTWNPSPNSDKVISGSEYMAMYLANEFRDLGYRVFVFGSFEDTDNKKDYQNTIDGIQYIDNSYFSDFCLTYVIDYLIVSRYLENLVYYDNVKNVYLWLHDIMPIGDFRFIQIHKEKFKGIICISEWQKRYIMKHAEIPLDSIYVSRNAIHPKRFLSNTNTITRVPFRFIYTSDPNRGLDNFLSMIPLLKTRYPQSTFYIFGKLEQINDESMKFIKSMTDYVFLSQRVSQDQLVIELQKSDVWLYPTCFTETYCISVVEAMASGCLIATNNEAALSEIVHDRGVMVDKNNCTVEEMNQKLFIELCKVLDDPKLKEEITERGYDWALKQDFHRLALDWKNKLFF